MLITSCMLRYFVLLAGRDVNINFLVLYVKGKY